MAHEYALPDRRISARVGEDFTVRLRANPTTGFHWEADFDDTLLGLVDQQFDRGGNGIGTGGDERFRFKVLNPGRGQLRLQYRRPWEEAPVEEAVFDVNLQPGP